MMKRLLFWVLVTYAYVVFPIPANRLMKEFKQKDGTSVSLMLVGDESFHYWSTIDGFPVLHAESEGYCYANVEDGELVNTYVQASNPEHRTEREIDFLNTDLADVRNNVSAVLKSKNCIPRQVFMRNAMNPNLMTYRSNTYLGNKKGLVILVEFANKTMQSDNTREAFDAMFNETGYSFDNHIGSVRDYFLEQSYGQFDIMFDVVGPVTLSRNYGYYGQNFVEYNGDKNVGAMVTEACLAVDDKVDFKDYDWNGDGTVETVYIIYAGYGESSGAEASTIWPHKSALSDRVLIKDGGGALFLDGVEIDVYACSCELAGYFGSCRNGIGTSCHEFSHCLGLPDLYDTDYSGAFGMNKWDIMDSGGHSGPNGRGEVPYGYSAFERACVGWLNLEEIDSAAFYTLSPLNDAPTAYILRNDACPDEFYVIENHQNRNWFSFLGENIGVSGMMVTHIDYDSTVWVRNNVNNTAKHMRQSIIPADNSYGTYHSDIKAYNPSKIDLEGDLFPGAQQVTRLSGMSHADCGGTLFNQSVDGTYRMNKTIDNISEHEEGIMSFSVGNCIEYPANLSLSISASNTLLITWNPVEDAKSYTLEVTKIYSLLPMKLETLVFDNIEETHLTVGDMDCKQCNVRIKSKNDYVTSEWSERVKMSMSSNHIETYEVDDAESMLLYDLCGRKVDYPTKSGIYIVKTNNSIYKKYIP